MDDISRKLISVTDSKVKLASFFEDSIILTEDFRLKVVSQNILNILGYAEEDLQHKNVNILSPEQTLQDQLRKALEAGQFENLYADIATTEGELLRVKMSGVYLGLISDLNGYIILRVNVLPESNLNRLPTELSELDEFIYRASHDLRGPLATIRGLVNILKLRKDDNEVDDLVNMIDDYALRLDDRLFRLFYVSDTRIGPTKNDGVLCMIKLNEELAEILHHYRMENTVSLKIESLSDVEINGVDDHNFRTVLNNLVLFLISLPTNDQNHIFISINKTGGTLIANVVAKGFTMAPAIRKVIGRGTYLYNDLLQYPLLMNFHVAKRLVYQMQGHMELRLNASHEIVIHLSIKAA